MPVVLEKRDIRIPSILGSKSDIRIPSRGRSEMRITVSVHKNKCVKPHKVADRYLLTACRCSFEPFRRGIYRVWSSNIGRP